jgi:hypothetical protein
VELLQHAQQWNGRVPDYKEPLEPVEECAHTQDTQDSTTEMPFPKVQVSLPPYLVACSDYDSSFGSETRSSRSEWLGPLERDDDLSNREGNCDDSADFADLEEDAFCDETDDQTVNEWCHDGSLYEAQKLSTEKFEEYYRDIEWSNEHVRLLGSRERFCGDTPGCIVPRVPGRSATSSDYWEMYWSDALLQPIVNETNGYAKSIVRLRRKDPVDPNLCVDEDEEVDIDRIFEVDIGEVDMSNDYHVYGMGGTGHSFMPCVVDGRAHAQSSTAALGVLEETNSVPIHGPRNDEQRSGNIGGPSVQRVAPPKTKGGRGWKNLTVMELRAYIGILIYMGIKKEPCRRNYWNKCHLLHCAVIPKVMSCRRWEAITRCLHLVDNDTVVRDCTQPSYDRIAKCWGIVEVFARRS